MNNNQTTRAKKHQTMEKYGLILRSAFKTEEIITD